MNNLRLIIFCIIFFIIFNLFINFFNCNNFIKENFIINHIPKIIHQTAPTDKNKWPKIWEECQKSWKYYFPEPEYEYKMWNDEDIDNFIKTDFNYFYEIYKNYDQNIKRIDMVRYFILYKYGGIYVDMDYKCFKNFYNIIPSNKVSISESPYKENEFLQNALMISPINHNFWLKVIDKAIERKDANNNFNNVLYQTGPVLISDVYYENIEMVEVLPTLKWNPKKNKNNDDITDDLITKHYFTNTWI